MFLGFSSNILVQSKAALAVAAFVCDAESREEVISAPWWYNPVFTYFIKIMRIMNMLIIDMHILNYANTVIYLPLMLKFMIVSQNYINQFLLNLLP